MAKSRQEQLGTVLANFYNKPVARVSAELFMSILAVIFFAVFVIKPTLQKMSELVKEINDKKELSSQLEAKIASLSTAQDQYRRNSDKFYLLDEAIPKSPKLMEALKIIEKLASDNTLAIQSITMSSLPDENIVAAAGSAERKLITLNVELAGNYLSLRQFVESLIESRRMILVEQVNFSLSNDRSQEKYLLAKLRINLPYYEPEQNSKETTR